MKLNINFNIKEYVGIKGAINTTSRGSLVSFAEVIGCEHENVSKDEICQNFIKKCKL